MDCSYVPPEQLYPSDLRARAKVDTLLDWHHWFLRAGATSAVRRKVMCQFFPPEHSGLIEIEQTLPERDDRYLRHSLRVLEDKLAEQQRRAGSVDAPVFFGAEEQGRPDKFTLADIFVFHEIAQVQALLPNPDDNGNLDAHERVVEWLQRMRGESPAASGVLHTLDEFMHKVVGVGESADDAVFGK